MAWINDLNLGRYHENIKSWIEKIKYVHPISHPAAMIVQDSLNQFVTKEEKTKWSNKLDADANAVSASKLQNPVKINGVPFDGTQDIDINTGYNEKTYVSEIEAKTQTIVIPDEYWIDLIMLNLYVNGIKLIENINFAVDKANKSIKLLEVYDNKKEIEIIFSNVKTNNRFVYENEINNKTINIETEKTISKTSIIYVFLNGKKLIKDKHYEINYEDKILNLFEGYSYKTNLEILIIKE